MALPRFTRTLHFRVSGVFLLMLALVAGGFWFWLNATVFSPDIAAEEENWYENLAESELDSLAGELGSALNQPDLMGELVLDYGRGVDRFDAEIIVFDAGGINLHSSQPESLSFTVPAADPELLAAMARDDWDYSSYPDPDDIDAYANRIFEVDRLFVSGDPDSVTAGFLVASFRPLVLGLEDIESGQRAIGYQTILLILIVAGLGGLVIMTWFSNRIRNLNQGVQEFAGGDLTRRVTVRSSDEIGDLGRQFNSMAGHIEEMVHKLQQKEIFQRQLIANISHDLRTPLASMRGYAETLTMKGSTLTAEEKDRYLEIITANLTHLDGLIDHMVTLSRFESGQTVFQMEEFPLAELVDSVLMRCEPLAADNGVKLDLEFDDATVTTVNADPLQIAQALQNLIENGIKFNRPGGKVTVKLEPAADQRLAVQVTDTGKGIAPGDLPHIFERFYTADKSRSRIPDSGLSKLKKHLGQSSGLGLAIAGKIVAGHQSELTVESQPGAGATFAFTLEAAADPLEMKAEG